MQQLIVALVSGKKNYEWVAQVGVADLIAGCLRPVPWFSLISLFLWSLTFAGILLNKGVSFYV
jgi:hypothetical protein